MAAKEKNQSLAEIQAQIKKLEEQAEEIRKAEFDEVLAEVKEKISAYGFTAKDLGLSAKKRGGAKGGEVAPKYKKGDETWTGRGRQPKWIAEHIKAGGKLEDLLIK